MAATIIFERADDRARALKAVRQDLKRSLSRADALGLSTVAIYLQHAIDELDTIVSVSNDI